MPSRHEIFRAADLLEATQGPNGVTIEGVRLVIGRGSKSDIGPALKEWRTVRRTPVSVPQVVAAKAQRLAADLYMLARWDAEFANGTKVAIANSPVSDASATPPELAKLFAKLSNELGVAAEMLDHDLAADRDESLRKLDQLTVLIGFVREKLTAQGRLDEFAVESKSPHRGVRKRQRRADKLTPSVEKILWDAKKPLLAAEIHGCLSPAMQKEFDIQHLGRTLDSRAWPGKIARWEVDPRRWRHLDIALPSEKPKKKSYTRKDTPRAKTRMTATAWAEEAVAWYRTHPGPAAAAHVFRQIKDNSTLKGLELDEQTFRRILHRRSYYRKDLQRVSDGPYTFQAKPGDPHTRHRSGTACD